MRYITILVMCLCAIVCATPANAGPIADSISYQGQLTDASDNPVPDGPKDLILSIWTDSVGGTMLHSEVVVATTSKGLFTTCIGCASSTFFDIFTDQSVYLQVQLAGSPPISPRTPMRNVPFSISTSSLHGKGTSGGSILSAAVSSVGQLSGGGGGGSTTASYARMSADSDGDGVPENDAILSVTPTTSGVAIKTKGTGADANRVVIIGGQTDVAGALHRVELDDNADGIPESSVRESSAPSISEIVVTKRSGSTTGTIRMAATPDSTSSSLEWDSDGDGIPESSLREASAPSISEIVVTKRSGSTTGTIRMAATPDSTSSSQEWDSDGDGIPESSLREASAPSISEIVVTKRSGSTAGTIRMAATPDSTVFELGYHGSTTGTIRLGAGSSGTANPIEHSSGAHLTPGGVWTNASDENLKENFQTVDGAELLEKLEELPISQWNYKSESDDITHIGPTAQDFQKAFGVGENNKTISTIDPSGIALAAIKELNKKNERLEKDNQTLRKEMDELKKLVQKLASAK